MASMSKEEREDIARSFAFFSAYSFLWKTDPNQATSSADEYWLTIIIGHFEPSNLTKMMCLELPHAVEKVITKEAIFAKSSTC
ncbi:hypothetical protein NC651_009355 [Populus alba x Populus x berolinensis]|nr:hypothetical protein NC651_009355 [Populus alba x Populus x berolinensis]